MFARMFEGAWCAFKGAKPSLAPSPRFLLLIWANIPTF